MEGNSTYNYIDPSLPVEETRDFAPLLRHSRWTVERRWNDTPDPVRSVTWRDAEEWTESAISRPKTHDTLDTRLVGVSESRKGQ